MSKFDHYLAAHNLIALLEDEGHEAEAAKLRSSIEDGATGTEILMALRFHLSEIMRQVSLSGEAQKQASRLLAELNSALT